MLDALPFGKNLHNCLLIFCSYFGALPEERVRRRPRASQDGLTIARLEAGDVLRLQALGTLADFKFNGLSFIE